MFALFGELPEDLQALVVSLLDDSTARSFSLCPARCRRLLPAAWRMRHAVSEVLPLQTWWRRVYAEHRTAEGSSPRSSNKILEEVEQWLPRAMRVEALEMRHSLIEQLERAPRQKLLHRKRTLTAAAVELLLPLRVNQGFVDELHRFSPELRRLRTHGCLSTVGPALLAHFRRVVTLVETNVRYLCIHSGEIQATIQRCVESRDCIDQRVASWGLLRVYTGQSTGTLHRYLLLYREYSSRCPRGSLEARLAAPTLSRMQSRVESFSAWMNSLVAQSDTQPLLLD